jgi:hypothetical protein
MSETSGVRPFPALTPEQRLYLDVNGYVIIRNVLTDSEIQDLLNTIYSIEKAYRKTGELPGPNCHLSSDREDYFRIDNLPHLADSFFHYLTHPYIVGMAEEIVGGSVRLEQSDAHIRRPVEAADGPIRYGFHRGISPAFSHTRNGLYHHSSGIIESDRDRVLILGGYTPPMFQAWNGYEADPVFADTVPEGERSLLTGSDKYGWQRKARELGTPGATMGGAAKR